MVYCYTTLQLFIIINCAVSYWYSSCLCHFVNVIVLLLCCVYVMLWWVILCCIYVVILWYVALFWIKLRHLNVSMSSYYAWMQYFVLVYDVTYDMYDACCFFSFFFFVICLLLSCDIFWSVCNDMCCFMLFYVILWFSIGVGGNMFLRATTCVIVLTSCMPFFNIYILVKALVKEL